MHWFSWTWLSGLVCCIKFPRPFLLVSGLCMLYHSSYCKFSCYLPLTKPGLRYLYSCSYADLGCPVIEISSFYRTQLSRCFPPSPEHGNRFSFRNVVLSSFQNTRRWTKSKNLIIPSSRYCFEPSSSPCEMLDSLLCAKREYSV
jgi:hypothetical protein